MSRYEELCDIFKGIDKNEQILIQPVKAHSTHNKRIDGAVTLIMLEEMYRRYKNIWAK